MNLPLISPRKVRSSRVIRAFTLIELLVVLSVIALLMALLLPSLAAARESSIRTKCLSNHHQIGVCIGMYANGNRDWGMGGYRGNPDLMDYAGSGPVYLGTLMDDGQIEIPPSILYCPSSKYAPSWKLPRWSKTTTEQALWNAGNGSVNSLNTNPNLSSFSYGSGTDPYAATRGTLFRLSPKLAIVMDTMGYATSNATYGNCPRNHDDQYFNYLRVDGSAFGWSDPTEKIANAIEAGVLNTGARFNLVSK